MAAGLGGANPIGWQDIDAFDRKSGLRLGPWEVEIIEALDDIFMSRDVPPR